jgi:N-acetylneuraminate synthase
MDFKIGNRAVGACYSPLIIAEIGINHGGNINVAKSMVDSAARCGVEVVKFQTHIVDDEMTHDAKLTIPGNTDKNIFDIMDDCSLTESEDQELKEYVEEKGMIYMSSAFSRAAALRLDKMNVQAIKIGSGECNNYPLLELVASFNRPTILSTGMNDIESIRRSVAIFSKNNTPLALLHTTNLYPTFPEEVRLGAMLEMHRAFPDLPYGLSDHTLDNLACIAAVANGASILERHFTDTKYRQGPDIICSMDELECNELLHASKTVFKMLGGSKNPLPREKVTSDFAFASVCSIRKITKGELLTEENIWVKRPGTGDFLAESYYNILGKVAKRTIESGVQLKKGDF